MINIAFLIVTLPDVSVAEDSSPLKCGAPIESALLRAWPKSVPAETEHLAAPLKETKLCNHFVLEMNGDQHQDHVMLLTQPNGMGYTIAIASGEPAMLGFPLGSIPYHSYAPDTPLNGVHTDMAAGNIVDFPDLEAFQPLVDPPKSGVIRKCVSSTLDDQERPLESRIDSLCECSEYIWVNDGKIARQSICPENIVDGSQTEK